MFENTPLSFNLHSISILDSLTLKNYFGNNASNLFYLFHKFIIFINIIHLLFVFLTYYKLIFTPQIYKKRCKYRSEV